MRQAYAATAAAALMGLGLLAGLATASSDAFSGANPCVTIYGQARVSALLTANGQQIR
jgi:hypothetical protein